jgi:hypothetical protein
MSKRRISFADQIRLAVLHAPVSRNALCKAARVDKGNLSRFMAGKAGLSLAKVVALADLLGLDIVARGPVRVPPSRRTGRPKGKGRKAR